MPRQSFYKVLLFLGLLVVAAGIGYVDWKTGYHINVVAFYSLPIIAAVWTLGNIGGYAVCLSTAFICYFARRLMLDAPSASEAVIIWNAFMRLMTLSLFYLAATAMRSRYEAMRTRVRMLSGLLPICNCCKRIRDEHGYWSELEFYLQEHSDASVEHKLCPDCSKRVSAGIPQPPAVSLTRRG